MRDAEIERLLGGYATNTLTDAERAVLFAAAIDDQELFNALEDEQALRELLEDGGSRRMIAAALAARQPVRTLSWFRTPWAWGAMACATAGLAIGFVLLQPRGAHMRVAMTKFDQPVTEPPAAPPAQTPAATQIPQQPKKLIAPPADRVPLAPAPVIEPPTVQDHASAPAPQVAAAGGFRAGAEAQMQQAQAGVLYTVLRRDSGDNFAPLPANESLNTADSLKLRVEAPASGSLRVLEQDANGEWTPLYPAAGTVPVTAHQRYTVPDTPIPLEAGKRLRLVFVSAPPSETALSTGVLDALARPKERYTVGLSSAKGQPKASVEPGGPPVRSPATGVPAVITTDITLAPGKPPQ